MSSWRVEGWRFGCWGWGGWRFGWGWGWVAQLVDSQNRDAARASLHGAGQVGGARVKSLWSGRLSAGRRSRRILVVVRALLPRPPPCACASSEQVHHRADGVCSAPGVDLELHDACPHQPSTVRVPFGGSATWTDIVRLRDPPRMRERAFWGVHTNLWDGTQIVDVADDAHCGLT